MQFENDDVCVEADLYVGGKYNTLGVQYIAAGKHESHTGERPFSSQGFRTLLEISVLS